MAGPWENYQSSSQPGDSSGPWQNYQQSAPQQGADVVSATEQKYGIPSGLLNAVISKESSGNPNAVSPKGAIGLGQVMPETAKGMGYNPERLKSDPDMQVDAAGKYLGQMLRQNGGDVTSALASYNWGPGNVQKYQSGQNQAMPQETQNYINDPRFAQWTQQQRPQSGSSGEMDYLNQEARQPWEPEQESPTLAQNVEQAGKGLLQAGVNVANIPGSVVNTALDAVGVPKQDQVYQFQLPQSARPTDPYAQLGAEIGPYLVPGVGAEKAAAATASAVGASRTERAANQVASMLSENLVGTLAGSQQNGQIDPTQLLENTGMGLAGSAVARAVPAVFNGVRGAIKNARGASESLPSPQAAADRAATQQPTGYSQPSVNQPDNFSPQQQPYTVRTPQDNAQPQAANSSTPESPAGVTPDTAQQYTRAAQSGNQGRIQQVVNDIQPDQNVADAMKRLDLDPDDMLEAYTSGNDAFKAVQMGLASQDESALGAVRRDSINRISNRASQIIDDAGAMPDRLSMNDKFVSDFNTTRNALKAQENALYKPVQDAIPAKAQIDPVNTRSYLDQLADEQGGYQFLSPVEKKVYEAVSPTTDRAGPPTYARLNAMRSTVGAELSKAGTPFGSAEERNLSALYSRLSDDRDAVARQAGFGDQIRAANAVTAQRKMMEERIYSLMGKDLSGDVTARAHNALTGLSNGNTKAFNQLMQAVPDKAARSQLIATGMRDMLRKGSRSDLANNINGFVDYYGSLKRNGSVRLLHRELPANTVRQLEDMYTIARNVKSANQYYLATGKLKSFLDKFEQPGGFLDKLATHGKMATIATVLGHVPVAGPVLNTAIAAQMGAKAATRKTGSEAVQELMSSPEWKRLASLARNKPSASVQEKIVSSAETRIAKTPAWKDFYRTLPAAEKQRLAKFGIIGWFSYLKDDRKY
ncbi:MULTISPECIES: lytic transglycosylase domain-containing protein [unclassified Tatumella]|uniref:lytic transglycosylase domain-containing protein n=1 Tax=unclassified Tatumella TaxID=2649542 RepID=UPI001BAFE54D|nr:MULTISPECIES: lytic transglycosylase domain-containing protein [unclassified Tatumella]MBS0878390.1 transglycosylase SLT domain-containing protein [Tatumella sp. JGM82]MBS0891186.1 transglycosylase SLT domain-containing protein [Tatumella sp. JGM94]MBS0902743.1 transglycosylase SLT domain-containing protein [Tatumella sp. JGM100]